MDWSDKSIKRIYQLIGRRTRLARIDKEMTQTELGQAVGLARSSIANIEAGRQHAPAHVVLLIAHSLGVEVAELLPSGSELDGFATVATPPLDLEGHADSTHEFVTTIVRRATGG